MTSTVRLLITNPKVKSLKKKGGAKFEVTTIQHCHPLRHAYVVGRRSWILKDSLYTGIEKKNYSQINIAILKELPPSFLCERKDSNLFIYL